VIYSVDSAIHLSNNQVVWWSGLVVRSGGQVWWSGLVVRSGGQVWWSGLVVSPLVSQSVRPSVRLNQQASQSVRQAESVGRLFGQLKVRLNLSASQTD